MHATVSSLSWLLLLIPAAAAHNNNLHRFRINFNFWGCVSPRNDAAAAGNTASSRSCYRNLEEFVIQELDRQHAKVWPPRGGGGGSVATAKRVTHNSQPAVLHFWTATQSNYLQLTHSNINSTTESNLTVRLENKPLETDALPSTHLESKGQSNHRAYAKLLKNRNNLNMNRKLTHAAFGLFFATLNQIVPRATFIPCMTILTSTALLMEMVRYRKGFGWINDVLHFFLGQSLRKHEMEGKFTGSFYYFLGVTLTSYLFPQSCASLGICQLALADPACSYFGRRTKNVSWSRIQQGFFGMGRNKGVLGFLLGALFCVPFNFRILSMAKITSGISSDLGGMTIPFHTPVHIGILSLTLGLAGAFADLCVPSPALVIPVGPMPRWHLDDNVIVPLFAGYACTHLFRMIGWTHVHLAPWLFL